MSSHETQDVSEPTVETEDLNEKYRKLQINYNNQQELISQKVAEVEEWKYCAALRLQSFLWVGATMGSLLWKCSSLPDAVKILIKGNRIMDVLRLTNELLDDYANAATSKTNEAQFLFSLCGTVTNIAAASEGRNFLSTCTIGRTLIANMVAVLPLIPIPSGNCLKRLLLMTLFNISINKFGLKFLQDNSDIIKNLVNCLKNETSVQIKLLELNVISCITCEIQSPDLLRKLENDLQVSFIEPFTRTDDSEINETAKKILANLDSARVKLTLNESKTIDGYRLQN